MISSFLSEWPKRKIIHPNLPYQFAACARATVRAKVPPHTYLAR
jgi:hypothetical protein